MVKKIYCLITRIHWYNEQLVAVMKQGNTTKTIDIQPVLDYIDKNSGVIFQSDISKKIHTAYETGILFQCANNDTRQELLQLTEDILTKCDVLLNRKEKNYKKKITYLLMAIHNIPRAFNHVDRTYLDIIISPFSLDDVKKSVDSYIALSEKT